MSYLHFFYHLMDLNISDRFHIKNINTDFNYFEVKIKILNTFIYNNLTILT